MCYSFYKNSDLNPMDENLDRIPKILYKYRSFDKCGHGLQLASNGEAYFASARNFNDPFENYFIPNHEFLNYEGDDLASYLYEKTQQGYPDADEKTIQELVEKGKEQHKRFLEGDPRAMASVMKRQYNNWGVFSISPDSKSLPMWSYYGDSHKGMCIGIRSSIIAQFQRDLIRKNELLMLHKVNYSKKIPVVNDLSGTSHEALKELEATLFTKSHQWQHEDEYRLLFFKYVSKSYIFGKDAVVEILVGLKASEENIVALVKQIDIANSNVVIKQAFRSQSEYTLEFKELDRQNYLS